jgi:hypothetical protein
VFPYSSGDERDPYVIANLVPELAVVFETKERAPFKVVFEILKLSELEKMSAEAQKAG